MSAPSTAWEVCPVGNPESVLAELAGRGPLPTTAGELTTLDAGLDGRTHLGLSDADGRERAEHRVRLALTAAASLGCPTVGVFAGSLGPFRSDRSELVSARLLESLRRLAEPAEDLGVGLTLRLPGGRGLLPGPLEARQLLDAVASWTAAAELALWPTASARHTPSWADWAATLGPRLQRIRLPVGSGVELFQTAEGRELAAALESVRFVGWVSVGSDPSTPTYLDTSTGELPHEQQQQ